MQSFRRALSVFAVGGMLYCASELLYRRRTHPSMFAAGGLALLTADRVRRVRCRGGAVVRVSLCTGAFTFIELCIGLLVRPQGQDARLGLFPNASELQGADLPALYAFVGGALRPRDGRLHVFVTCAAEADRKRGLRLLKQLDKGAFHQKKRA